MKQFLLVCFICCSINLYGQYYYKYEDRCITLEEVPKSETYVLSNDTEQNSSNVFTTNKSNNIVYTSKYYRTPNNNEIAILPRIVVKLCDGYIIDDIISEYNDVLSVETNHKQIYVLNTKAKNSDEVLNLVMRLTDTVGIEWCEPDMLQNLNLNNTLFSQQYYLNNIGQNGGKVGMDINVIPAWSLVKGNPNITVAVIDSGVDKEHADVKNVVLDGYTVGNPYGFGFPQNYTKEDDKAHGTRCAGVVAAEDNDIGILGVASGVKILPVNIFPNVATEQNKEGSASSIEMANAIIWAYQWADILSCSWSNSAESSYIVSALREAVSFGRNGKGCIVVFASGNQVEIGGDLSVSSPANISDVITVGAIDRKGQIAYYSRRGASMDLVAPGEDITTTDFTGNGSNYCTFSGTSAACPQVAGVAALMLSANPNMSTYTVKNILQQTARDLGDTGWDETYGYGLVDAGSAVAWSLCTNSSISGPSIVESSGVYNVTNLPENTYVTWRYINKDYIGGATAPSLSADNPQKNAVTVNNYNKKAFSVILEATIHFDDTRFKPYTITRHITGDGTLTGLVTEIKLDGTKDYERPLSIVEPGYEDEENENWAYPASDVIVKSNNFIGRNVSYTSPLGNGNCVVNDATIQFEMLPLSKGQTMDFTVSGGGISSVHKFKFAALSNSYYNKLSINKYGERNYLLKINDDSSGDAKSISSDTKSNKQWTLEIYDAIGLNKIVHTEITDNQYILETSGMQRGIYIVRAKFDGQIYSGKLSVD